MSPSFSFLRRIDPEHPSSGGDLPPTGDPSLKAAIARERIRCNALALERRTGIFVHALLLTQNDDAYLFLGTGGIGKTTLGRRLSSFFTLGNDDCNFVAFPTEGEPFYRAYSTPFYTVKKEPPPPMNDISGILRGLFVLEQERERETHLAQEADRDRVWKLFMGSPIALPHTKNDLYPVMNEMVARFIEEFSFPVLRHNLVDPPERVAQLILSPTHR